MTLDSSTTLTDGQRDRILAIAAAESASSGRRPLGQSARSDLLGEPTAAPIARHWLWHDPDLQAYGCEFAGDPAVVEVTGDPAHPQAVHGLLAGIRQELPAALLWTHGDRAQGRIAAAVPALAVSRELLILARPVSVEDVTEPDLPPGLVIRPFQPSRDTEEFLQLNRQVFADLPDQRDVTAADLAIKLESDIHDPTGFLVAERDGRMLGFHWTKVDATASLDGEPTGEVYVIGVAASERGSGLARLLLDAGLAHLARGGVDWAYLFVESTNSGALRFYEKDGFVLYDADRQYSW